MIKAVREVMSGALGALGVHGNMTSWVSGKKAGLPSRSFPGGEGGKWILGCRKGRLCLKAGRCDEYCIFGKIHNILLG